MPYFIKSYEHRDINVPGTTSNNSGYSTDWAWDVRGTGWAGTWTSSSSPARSYLWSMDSSLWYKTQNGTMLNTNHQTFSNTTSKLFFDDLINCLSNLDPNILSIESYNNINDSSNGSYWFEILGLKIYVWCTGYGRLAGRPVACPCVPTSSYQNYMLTSWSNYFYVDKSNTTYNYQHYGYVGHPLHEFLENTYIKNFKYKLIVYYNKNFIYIQYESPVDNKKCPFLFIIKGQTFDHKPCWYLSGDPSAYCAHPYQYWQWTTANKSANNDTDMIYYGMSGNHNWIRHYILIGMDKIAADTNEMWKFTMPDSRYEHLHMFRFNGTSWADLQSIKSTTYACGSTRARSNVQDFTPAFQPYYKTGMEHTTSYYDTYERYGAANSTYKGLFNKIDFFFSASEKELLGTNNKLILTRPICMNGAITFDNMFVTAPDTTVNTIYEVDDEQYAVPRSDFSVSDGPNQQLVALKIT